MRILFDKSAPNKLIPYIEGHAVSTAEKQGWDRLENGDLLKTAEEAGFDVFFTADKNLRYQQNLMGRRIALVVLGNSPWPLVQLHIPKILEAIYAAKPGSYAEIEIPLPPKKPFTNSPKKALSGQWVLSHSPVTNRANDFVKAHAVS
jgi:hypothetical protein